MKCGRDLVRRQEILPKLQQEEEEEEEQEEEEEEEEEKPRALWRTGSVGRTGLRGRTGADRRSGWRVLINHLVTFPAPDRPHHDPGETFEGPAGQERPNVQPVQRLIGRLTTACPQSPGSGK